MSDAFVPGTSIPTSAEQRRLDDLTAYNSTILAHLSGDQLEAALLGYAKCWPGRSDASMRQAALDNVHPDDLCEALVTRGFTLASVGIVSIAVASSEKA